MNKKLFSTSLFILAFSLLAQFPLQAQDKKINWVTIEQAQELHKKNPKKIFVDIYTDWCSWCKRMDAETFTHPVIVDYINENFYAVKLNAEQKEPIVFKGVKYENERADQRRGAHNFAIAILQGRMSYPSVAFFDENLGLIYALPGFRTPLRMEPVLVFFNEDIYKSNPNLDEFSASFQGKISQ
jgi:thioredoxin-related protein